MTRNHEQLPMSYGSWSLLLRWREGRQQSFPIATGPRHSDRAGAWWRDPGGIWPWPLSLPAKRAQLLRPANKKKVETVPSATLHRHS